MQTNLVKNLPAEFSDLQDLAGEWALATQAERNEKRVNSSMDELKEVYDRVSARLKDIATHLDKFPIDAIPRSSVTLLHLGMMLMEISPAVEVMGTPDVVSDYPRERLIIHSQRDQYKVAESV